MYYHVRLDKIFHDGCTDMDSRIEWDFRSLEKALAMIGREFGADAACWRIEDVTSKKADIMQLEADLKVALESTHQYIIMTFSAKAPALEKYDHYKFFVAMREETECPPTFSFSEEEEAAIIVPEIVFEPDVRRSIADILRSFEMDEDFDVVGNTIDRWQSGLTAAFSESHGNNL